MSKASRKARRKKAGAAAPRPQAPANPARRAALLAMKGGAAVTLLGGGGWWFYAGYQAHKHEHDLSRIGDGTPAVVQIHDPQCPQCLALQRATRAALSTCSENELNYIVADIRSIEGRSLAAAHGVGHVTLLLMDGDGRRRDTLVGVRDSAALRRRFKRHVAEMRAG